MATLTPQFFQLLEAEEKDVFFQAFTQQPTKYTQLFSTQSSTKAYEDRLPISGLGTFATKPEGTPIAFDDPVQGLQIRTVHQTYALGWRASMEMMQDDQFAVMNRMSSELGESARDHQERLAWNLINDGFTGTITGFEGDTLFDAAHGLRRGNVGQTVSNILNPPVALSQTGIEDILTMSETTTSDENRYVELSPTMLVCHPSEMHNAYVLLNTEKRPGSADNDVSSVVSSRSGLTVLTSPHLSSTTNWYVFSPPGKNTLTYNNRMSVEFSRAQDADTKDQKFYGCYRASVMWSEWRGSWGSQA